MYVPNQKSAKSYILKGMYPHLDFFYLYWKQYDKRILT